MGGGGGQKVYCHWPVRCLVIRGPQGGHKAPHTCMSRSCWIRVFSTLAEPCFVNALCLHGTLQYSSLVILWGRGFKSPPPLVNGTGNSPVSETADPRSSQTGQVIQGLR